MKIICIGRNYIDHANELKNEIPENPLFFLKPDSSILPKRNPFYIPNFTKNVHYEVEVVVKICKLGKNIGLKFASDYYNEIGLGIDFTARDIQDECKKKGYPWEIAKSFDQSAVISNIFIPKKNIDLTKLEFSLVKNDQIVQKGITSEMIFSIDQIICYVSKFMTLKIGDLIFTGTPKGVGKVTIDDTLIGYIEDKEMFRTRIK